METKLIEIRDSGTFIPAMAVKLIPTNEQDQYLLARAGFGSQYAGQCEYIVLMNLNGGEGHFDCEFFDRTYATTLNYLKKNWDEVVSGQVVDVEFILGERSTPKKSECKVLA